ncbi:FAD linked oxidase domain-containing protein [Planoprotostelium fungivorum]|uniref:FAD linked oxidase domain-containing protein n=1 Tax=Planoprotostelium fungivorum TaxID=1890364 RepID=A0A2P6NJQ0_9EUKA|nr:FAD linked oxidase domain-containing protein [Planoprotostelium fungivorum]
MGAAVIECLPDAIIHMRDEAYQKVVRFVDVMTRDKDFGGRIVTRAACEPTTQNTHLPPCDYDLARKLPALRLDHRPLLIVFCTSAHDVSSCVKNIRTVWPQDPPKVNIRSGGHSYEGISCEDDAIVIDCSAMDDIMMSADDKTTLWVGAGCKLGRLYHFVSQNLGHEFDVPAGTAISVGAGGLMTGGGYGMLSRKVGLATDHVSAITMVDANGDVLVVDRQNHPDLFWAMRGAGGGSFGVVTKFRLEIVKAPPKVTLVHLEWDFDDIIHVISAFEEWLPSASDDFTAQLDCWATHLHLQGKFLGNPEECLKMLSSSPLLDGKKCPPRSIQMMYLSPAEANLKISCGTDATDFDDLIGGDKRNYCGAWPEEKKSKKKSDFVYRGKLFGPEGAAVVRSRLMQDKGKTAVCQLEAYGGFFSTCEEGDTPYPHRRDATISLQYWTNWDDEGLTTQEEKLDRDRSHEEWMKSWEADMATYVSGKKYRNYEDADSLCLDWGDLYYGKNFEKLKEIKGRYDPDDVFRCKFSIPLPSKSM